MQVVQGFEHIPGFHCGTTSVRSMLHFFGFEFSEPMILGLSNGLWTGYFRSDRTSPTRILMTRHGSLELDAFRNLGVQVQMRQTADPKQALDWIRDEIDAGRPAMLQVDLAGLPFYNTSTSFAGHKIIVYGYDNDAGEVLVSDNEFDQPQTVTYEKLELARVSPEPLFDLFNNWFEIVPPSSLTPLEIAIPRALKAQCDLMLVDTDLFGIQAMEQFSRDLPGWVELPDWSWSARWAYQIIEKRGTGGGGFRKQYANFLDEAEPLCPDIKKYGLTERMHQIAEAWTNLALVMRDISDMPGPDFTFALPYAREIAISEADFFNTMDQVIVTSEE